MQKTPTLRIEGLLQTTARLIIAINEAKGT
jgi:hypothetical protein